ncbi:uncharacterized protein LOC144459837 [Epinephelus lanceolatus]
MCCLLPLAALLLLSIVPSVTEVVHSMSDCAEFLLEQTPPDVPGVLEGGIILDQNRYKVICQTLTNVRTFVTVYDTQNRIPVFSANKYRGEDGGKRPDTPWKIEPQLENIRRNKNMVRVSRNKIYNKQAGDIDYRNNGVYDRGHLFPCSYGATENNKNATFTLTNIVPQEKSFNQGSWQRMESCIKCVLDKYCINNNNITEGFLVIGAQPGNNKLKDRVNIPSMLWSAFCCYSHSENKWLASAHWGENIKDSSKYLQTKTLAELYNKLSTPSSVFEVFPGKQCPLHTTVTQFYPKLNKDCHCPPLISTTSASPTTTATSPVLTSAPLTTTSAPPSTTADLLSTTFTSLSTTSVPPSTTPSTSGPPTTTSNPFTTTSVPPSTTSVPPSTTPSTSGPPSTTSDPFTTTSDMDGVDRGVLLSACKTYYETVRRNFRYTKPDLADQAAAIKNSAHSRQRRKRLLEARRSVLATTEEVDFWRGITIDMMSDEEDHSVDGEVGWIVRLPSFRSHKLSDLCGRLQERLEMNPKYVATHHKRLHIDFR